MKTLTFISLAAWLHLAAGQSPVAPPASTQTVFWSDGKPAATGAPGSNGAAICGQGYTYCGYILRDHQNFREEDIVRVYCASAKDNCANGKTKSDPLQALYVCLPPQSQAIPVPNDIDDDDFWSLPGSGSGFNDNQDTHMPLQPHNAEQHQHNWNNLNLNPGHGGDINNLNFPNAAHYNYNNLNKNPNVHGLRHRRQAGGSGSGSGSDTCSSTPTTGNQLALLCSCGNKCLNPKEDHIGRCDTPCSQ
ncbi:hypothetical protein V8F20_002631 [Naviculisporaceae sp. PSN 640]